MSTLSSADCAVSVTRPVKRRPSSATPIRTPYAEIVFNRPATVAVVPIRSFTGAKHRLSDALDATGRERLSRWTANNVLDALDGFDVLVVTDDEVVASWARTRMCDVLSPGAPGLNKAAAAARTRLTGDGVDRMALIHSDLALPRSLPAALSQTGAVIVPDLSADGTNVLVLPVNSQVQFGYGPGSFRRHLDRCLADTSVGSIVIHRDRRLGLDLDTAIDLRHPLVANLIEEVIT